MLAEMDEEFGLSAVVAERVKAPIVKVRHLCRSLIFSLIILHHHWKDSKWSIRWTVSRKGCLLSLLSRTVVSFKLEPRARIRIILLLLSSHFV